MPPSALVALPPEADDRGGPAFHARHEPDRVSKGGAGAAEVHAAAVALPNSERRRIPKPGDDDKSHDEQVLGHFLGLALANRCAEMNVAQPLVGTASDLRHLVRWNVYNDRPGEPPRLTQTWRAEVGRDLLEDILEGRISLRVADPQSDHQLVFERRESETAGPA